MASPFNPRYQGSGSKLNPLNWEMSLSENFAMGIPGAYDRNKNQGGSNIIPDWMQRKQSNQTSANTGRDQVLGQTTSTDPLYSNLTQNTSGFGDLLKKTNTGGGSGGGNPGPNPSPNPEPTGASQDDFMNEINNVYSDSENYLNQVEGNLRNDFPNVLKEAESMYNTSRSQLDNSRTSTLNQIQQGETKATDMKDNALAEARRLYDQLQRGYLQRFGGSSSAGQAASEIGSVEQQRQMGSVNRDYRNTLQQIETQKVELENQFQTQLLSLEQNKQAAINNANRDFQNKLMEVNKMRAEMGQNKAQLRLQALQELRSRVYQIEDENRQFQQQLQAQKQASELSLQQYAQQATQATGNTSSYVDEFGNIQYAPSANMTVQGGGNPGMSPLMGQISLGGGRDEDLYNMPGLTFAN